MDVLDKGTIHIVDGMGWEGARFQHATQNNVHFRTYELFLEFPFNIYRWWLTEVNWNWGKVKPQVNEIHCVMFAMCWAGLWPYDVVMGFWAGQSFVSSDKILPEHTTFFPLQDLCTTGSLCLEYSAGSLQGWLLLDCSSSGRPFLPVYTD